MSFFVDSISVLFGGTVSFIIMNVFVFACSYMREDSFKKHFFFPLSLFSGSMLVLIFSGDVATLFLAWDGLGISSFLLVVFYSKSQSASSGVVTIMTNRLGDGCLLIGLCIVGFEVAPVSSEIVCGLFVVAAFSKSAQWPLSSWLPAAMAAPTPVSSLVHSSTLVTAGVYLLLRVDSVCHSLLVGLQELISVTFFLACLSALYSYDIKHIIAMSTLSHLSLMFLSLSAGYISVVLFHLISHAMFKALTFLAAGNMILSAGHSQDLRLMGGCRESSPISFVCFYFASLSLAGFFFTSGFYSKDLILEILGSGAGSSIGWLGISFGSFCAGCYAMDLVDSVSGLETNLSGSDNKETDGFLLAPLISLSLASLIVGWYLSVVLIPCGGVASGGVDLAFLMGLLVGSEEGEYYKSDYKVEESMLFSVEGVPEAKVFFWEGVLSYTKDLEHGFYEDYFGPGGFLKFCGSWSRWGSKYLVW
uniref:NADH:ubiquinone reductase (H(+)-translocating) n=1 Tax=Spirobranchus giganteus TaxID=1914524 RepID=A0A1I9WKB7_9ANNE|nr:NADH dehydrogenase subunit 5 [Spirobranchus giganteus]APA32612.1 NADH dehydrogenase subunit 5 [Spirobranchus giganteus]